MRGRTSAGATDKGAHRPSNQDSLFADDGLGLYIVADGVGGAPHGDIASNLAVDAASAFVETALQAFAGAEFPLTRTADAAIQAAAAAVFGRGCCGPRQMQMKTTFSLLLTRGSEAAIAHIGDSRIYRVRGCETALLTRDDTVAAQLVAAGDMTPEEATRSPMAHVLTRCLGRSAIVQTRSQALTVSSGDLFVLITDGLNPAIQQGALRSIYAEPLAKAPATLIGAAVRQGSKDNLTAVVVRCDPEPTASQRWRDAERRSDICCSAARGV